MKKTCFAFFTVFAISSIVANNIIGLSPPTTHSTANQIDGTRKKESLDAVAIEKEAHAKEKKALIDHTVQTRLYLVGLREEFQFLREAFTYLISKNEIERDDGVDDRIFKKMQEVKDDHIKIVNKLDQAITSVTNTEISVRGGAGAVSSEGLKLTRERLEISNKKFIIPKMELNKAAAFFNGLNVEEKKAIDEAVLKMGYPLCPAFVKRCERIANQILAENPGAHSMLENQYQSRE
jgi:hypothetical protein